LEIYREHTSWITCLKVLNEENLLASGSKDTTIKIWSLTSNVCLKTFREHSSVLYDFELTSKSHHLISCSGDSIIRVWDLSKFECVKVLNGHSQGVKCLKLLRDDKRNEDLKRKLKVAQNAQVNKEEERECLLSASSDNTVKMWNLNTGQCLNNIQTNWEVSMLELCPI
jgi:WD40 repeat protein